MWTRSRNTNICSGQSFITFLQNNQQQEYNHFLCFVRLSCFFFLIKDWTCFVFSIKAHHRIKQNPHEYCFSGYKSHTSSISCRRMCEQHIWATFVVFRSLWQKWNSQHNLNRHTGSRDANRTESVSLWQQLQQKWNVAGCQEFQTFSTCPPFNVFNQMALYCVRKGIKSNIFKM